MNERKCYHPASAGGMSLPARVMRFLVTPGRDDESGLACDATPANLPNMNTTELAEQTEALPEEERAEFIERLHANAPAWILESFREGMADIAAGRIVELDEAIDRPFTGQNQPLLIGN